MGDRLVWLDTATGQWLNRRISQEAVGWQPVKQTDDIDKLFGFFDHQVFPVTQGGGTLLFGRNRLDYGYAGVDTGGREDRAANDFSVVGYAIMKPNCSGTAFRCEDPRISVMTHGVADLREPCLIRQDDGGLMLVTGKDGLYLYRSASLTDPFEKVTDGQFSDGCLYPLSWQDESGRNPSAYQPAQGLAGASLVNVGNGRYRLYLSKINDRLILAAETDLSRQLTDGDFMVIADPSILPPGEKPLFLGNPDVLASPAVTPGPASPPVVSEPVTYSFSDYKRSGLLLGMGSSSNQFYSHAGGLSVKHQSNEETISFLFLIPNAPQQPMHEQCSAQVTVTLPEDPSALGGLLINWQENGRSNGGVAFMVGHDKWQLIHVQIGQLTGMISPVGSAESITVLREGTFETPFSSGILSCTWVSGVGGDTGKFFLMIDGQSIAIIDSSVWGEVADPHIAGQIGLCTRSIPSDETYEFSDVRAVDLAAIGLAGDE